MDTGGFTSGPGTDGGDLGDCCAFNGSPGCEDPTCEAAVCALDPFCCDNQWDWICGALAYFQCPAVCP